MACWTDDKALAYLRKIVAVWDEAPGESDEESAAEELLRSAARRLGYDDDEIVAWVHLGASDASVPKRRERTRGDMLTLGEVRALKPGDVVWFNYQKTPEFPNRIDEPGEVTEVHERSVDIELASGELYDFDLSQHDGRPDSAPAKCECSPGTTTLYDVEDVT